jgi:RimJ/RimL family protein N-acetyltransferase
MEHPHWPLFDLEVVTPRVTLRYIDDELGESLVEVASAGIHDPGFMPFAMPWTDTDPAVFGQQMFQYWWKCRTNTSIDTWDINLAVLVDGEVVGATGLGGRGFPTTRRFETGSWLGRRSQGTGLGTELRTATLHLGFIGLDPPSATTGAFFDNGPSLGVTHKLGYEPNGVDVNVRRGEPAETLRYHMTRRHFVDNLQRDDIVLNGDEGARKMLGISR